MAKKSRTRSFVEEHDDAIQKTEDAFARMWHDLTVFVGKTIRHLTGG